MQYTLNALNTIFENTNKITINWPEESSIFKLSSLCQCPSKTFGGFDSTKDLPDDVITFARLHPAMYNPVQPMGGKPIVVRTNVEYQFTQLVVDRVEAEDGQYDVMFIGTG